VISVFEKNENLKTEWSDKNIDIDPTKISYGSMKKVWWICDKGHEWQAVIKNRTKDNPSGCPFCSNSKVLKGYNDLESRYPDIAKEWSDKNSLKPCEVMPMSNKKAWFKCSLGHEYETIISSRTYKGSGCPYCNGVILKGYNDLETTHPMLAREYSFYNKNRCDQIKANSKETVRWKCIVCNNEWMMRVSTRVNGSGCPECEKKRRLKQRIISDQKRRDRRKFDQHRERNILLYYLKSAGIDYIENDNNQIGINLSIYLPSKKVAIELSEPSHVTEIGKKRERSKDRLCKMNGIQMIRILDPGYASHDNCIAIRKHDFSDEACEQAIEAMFGILGYNIVVKIDD